MKGQADKNQVKVKYLLRDIYNELRKDQGELSKRKDGESLFQSEL